MTNSPDESTTVAAILAKSPSLGLTIPEDTSFQRVRTACSSLTRARQDFLARSTVAVDRFSRSKPPLTVRNSIFRPIFAAFGKDLERVRGTLKPRRAVWAGAG